MLAEKLCFSIACESPGRERKDDGHKETASKAPSMHNNPKRHRDKASSSIRRRKKFKFKKKIQDDGTEKSARWGSFVSLVKGKFPHAEMMKRSNYFMMTSR